jgi:hypothetical protein
LDDLVWCEAGDIVSDECCVYGSELLPDGLFCNVVVGCDSVGCVVFVVEY